MADNHRPRKRAKVKDGLWQIDLRSVFQHGVALPLPSLSSNLAEYQASTSSELSSPSCKLAVLRP